MKLRLSSRSASITFKTKVEIKDLLERLAKQQFRSLSQQCEMIVIKWLIDERHIEHTGEIDTYKIRNESSEEEK